MTIRNIKDVAKEMHELYNKLKAGKLGKKQAAEQRLTLLAELKAYTLQHKHESDLGEGKPIEFFKNDGTHRTKV